MGPPNTERGAALADPARGRQPDACPGCGWPVAERCDIVSRHRTSEGLVVWARCICGALQMRRYRTAGVELVAQGGHRWVVGG
jgi:hypothetical protein